MRKLVLGMLLAAGAAVPTIAVAQDDGHRPDNPRKWASQRENGRPAGERPNGGGRQEQPRAAPAAPFAAPAQPRPQPAAPQAQAQVQAQGRFDGRNGGGQFRGDGGARFNGDARRFDRAGQPDTSYRPAGAPPAAQRPEGYRGQGYRGEGYRGEGYRGQGDPRSGQGSGGYRAQDNARYVPGQGGYRAQGGYRPAPPPPGPGGRWNRGWRDNGQFNYSQYRAQNNYLYRLPRYYAPAGWGYGYRRFSPGITLSAVLFAQDYWIDDPFYYRLPPAYGPYRWVRYYNDALLIDLRSGVVVDTVYDIFW